MKGKIKIQRISDNIIQDKVINEKNLVISNNHILKKHYQNFKLTKHEIEKLKLKIKNFGSEILLDKVINQGDEIYCLVNSYYHEITDKLDSISDQISAVSDCVNFLQELNLNQANQANLNTPISIKGGNNTLGQIGTNSSANSLGEGRANSLKISTKHFYLEKVNKLKKLEAEYTLKNKEINFKVVQLQEDNKFLDQITKEKENLIDSLSEDQLRRIGESYSHDIQITAMKLLLTSMFNKSISPTTTEKEIVEMFKVIF